MRKTFSKFWVASKQPRKQRKYRYNAPSHIRHSMLSAHLQKGLRKELGRRSMVLKKGDEVEIRRGEFSGRRGAVSAVDMKRLKILIEGIKRKKVSGQDIQVPIDPSNVVIVKVNLEDKKRKKIISRKTPETKQ
ncbi:MAG: 50S ribosomal protein L24 [Candidatus Aenigmarchaeota archaeon]|nr:50S ribosomal protein L24P [uncultured archaeon]MBS3053237.1 50S ribosomal protein L24 [Candidatus Aenigmarchaeota archaeon]